MGIKHSREEERVSDEEFEGEGVENLNLGEHSLQISKAQDRTQRAQSKVVKGNDKRKSKEEIGKSSLDELPRPSTDTASDTLSDKVKEEKSIEKEKGKPTIFERRLKAKVKFPPPLDTLHVVHKGPQKSPISPYSMHQVLVLIAGFGLNIRFGNLIQVY
jgi:hypothetical protein